MIISDEIVGGYRVVEHSNGTVVRTVHSDSVPDEVPPVLSADDFLSRFTFAEQLAMKSAAQTDLGIDTLLDNLRIRSRVDLASAFTAQARTYLLSKAPIGVLTAERINAIFGD